MAEFYVRYKPGNRARHSVRVFGMAIYADQWTRFKDTEPVRTGESFEELLEYFRSAEYFEVSTEKPAESE